MKIQKSMLGILLLQSLLSHAQSLNSIAPEGGVGTRGGGREKEIAAEQLMLDLVPYVESADGRAKFPAIDRFNEDSKRNPKVYVDRHPETFSDILTNTHVVIRGGKVYDDFNFDRDCVTHFDNPHHRYVECTNGDLFPEAILENQRAIYGFVFHEALVAAGIETHGVWPIPSDYHDSKRLTFYKKVEARWVPGEGPRPMVDTSPNQDFFCKEAYQKQIKYFDDHEQRRSILKIAGTGAIGIGGLFIPTLWLGHLGVISGAVSTGPMAGLLGAGVIELFDRSSDVQLALESIYLSGLSENAIKERLYQERIERKRREASAQYNRDVSLQEVMERYPYLQSDYSTSIDLSLKIFNRHLNRAHPKLDYESFRKLLLSQSQTDLYCPMRKRSRHPLTLRELSVRLAELVNARLD